MTGPLRDPWDVVIVGAGPAGSTAAILLARAGARVALLDKARFPRDKLCGEFVAPESLRVLDRIGVLPELAAIAGRARSVVLSDARGRSVRLPVPGRPMDRPSIAEGARTWDGRTARPALTGSEPPSGPVALGVSRREMDALLVARARREGAEVIEGLDVHAPVFGDGWRSSDSETVGLETRLPAARALASPEPRDSGRGPSSGAAVTGVVARDRATGRETTIRARFVIAADGRDSAMARALSPVGTAGAARASRSRSRASALFGLQAHFRNVPDLGGAVELHYFQGGYVGLHAIGGGRVNACALIDRSLARPTEREPERIARELFFANAAARARLERAERISDWLAVGSLVFRAEAPVRGGVLFLGDAAGTIDPFAGEGMSMAFRSAEIAAEEIALALGLAAHEGEDVVTRARHADAGEHARRAYALRWRREFTLRIAICRTIGRLAARRAVQTPVIAALGALPFVGRLLAGSTRAGVPLGLGIGRYDRAAPRRP